MDKSKLEAMENTLRSVCFGLLDLKQRIEDLEAYIKRAPMTGAAALDAETKERHSTNGGN